MESSPTRNTIQIDIYWMSQEHGLMECYSCGDFYHVPRIGEKIQIIDGPRLIVVDVINKMKINAENKIVQNVEVHGVIYYGELRKK